MTIEQRLWRQAWRDGYRAVVYGPVMIGFLLFGCYVFDGGAAGQILRALT